MLPKSLLLWCRGDWRLCCWKTCLKIRSRSTEPKSLALVKVTGSARTCRKNSQKTLLEFVTAIIGSKSLNWFVFFNCDLKISLFLLQLQFNQSSLLLEFHFWHLDTIVWWKCFLWRRKSFPELQATQSVFVCYFSTTKSIHHICRLATYVPLRNRQFFSGWFVCSIKGGENRAKQLEDHSAITDRRLNFTRQSLVPDLAAPAINNA